MLLILLGVYAGVWLLFTLRAIWCSSQIDLDVVFWTAFLLLMWPVCVIVTGLIILWDHTGQ